LDTRFSSLPVFFATDQLHRPSRSAKIQPMSQTLPQLSVSREKNEKDEKFVHFTRQCGDIFQVW